ncbi:MULTISPECIES: endonuclease domain-containing protein [Asticcacaulis]|uniref:endonuclease domain-containing protein n=1 Tax=Asticcacaulis TaxID=76890 RepID=UPI001AE99309|nr:MULTISPECIES: endonuclease domain-containing protein [Asticcacaulis]MBP2161732.1 very-short-patch-repair endonuclease [Asticcacaulis solisilvae]MDR6802756.1 very-short-patch-repair endonuclease [Asticcacaulis sp. BE141]
MRRKYEQARKLRKAMTEPEKLLWYRIRQRGDGAPIFRRQCAIGNYILDFYCVQARLAVEVDGYFHSTSEGHARDAVRDARLGSQGIEVYRIPAADVFANADEVADGVILKASALLGTKRPPPPLAPLAFPLPTSGEE